ncbi:cyclin-like protein [Auricularia subglabra TFB-10046 SS5]|nr:cyclin-like protein [Auricularia subglabra TFB-10046 SS5]
MFDFPLHAPATPAEPTYGPDLAVRLICPDCRDPHPRIVEEFSSGDLVCADCGLVLGDRIVDTRSECARRASGRTFADNEGDDPSRVGAAQDPLLDEAEQLSTSIGFRDDGTGAARELRRALQGTVAGIRASRTQRALRDIGDKCAAFGMPLAVAASAKLLFKRVEEQRLLRSQAPDAVVATCIFVACRMDRATARTFHDICTKTRVPRKVLARCFRVLERAFQLAPAGQGAVAGARAEDLLARHCSRLALRPGVATCAASLIVRARDLGTAGGRNPKSVAGAAIYFAARLLGDASKSAGDIAHVAGIQEATLLVVYKMMHADRDKLVMQEWIDEGKVSLEGLPPC